MALGSSYSPSYLLSLHYWLEHYSSVRRSVWNSSGAGRTCFIAKTFISEDSEYSCFASFQSVFLPLQRKHIHKHSIGYRSLRIFDIGAADDLDKHYTICYLHYLLMTCPLSWRWEYVVPEINCFVCIVSYLMPWSWIDHLHPSFFICIVRN